MQTKLLKMKMLEHGDDVTSLAQYLGIARQTLSSKINGNRDFKQSEIDVIADRYNLTPHEVVSIFLS